MISVRRLLTAIDSGLLFFFSSRRRHTRFDCDWSSDVCSSDLASSLAMDDALLDDGEAEEESPANASPARSEERRVGKECRSRWSAYDEKKNTVAHQGGDVVVAGRRQRRGLGPAGAPCQAVSGS